MGSVGRVLTQVRTTWGEASRWQRVASAITLTLAAVAIVALAAGHLATPPEEALPRQSSHALAPAGGASEASASPPTEPVAGHPASPLSFKPFSSLQSAASRDAENRIAEAMAAFRDVVRPRVLIRPAIESPFGEDSQPASALVIVGVREGGALTADSIKALAECATASGASLDHVSILSEGGVQLFRDGTVLVSEFSGPASPSEGALSAPPQSSEGPTLRTWPVVAVTAGVALLVGLLGGWALARPRPEEPERPEQADEGRAPVGSTVSRPRSVSSPLVALTPDELLSVVAGERPATTARLLERADDEAAAAALQALPEMQRREALAVNRGAVRPWRRSHAALQRAALAKLAARGEANGARD